ncbi:MAG: Holliday junction branch migration protein RuvA [Schwartzia sp.]|nr:Holliday junction branch migration protein RuvA [Schwartzia sp. (in: firmicutes)]
MIGFLRGKVTHLLTDACLLDVGGVGYRVYVAGATRSRLKPGEEVTLFTHLSVREDALTLYGFYSQEEYNIFQLLISVSGIGPKVALGILSATSVENLCRAIHGQQLAVLTKLPGIGKKSAQRLILELKDKVGGDDGPANEFDAAPLPPGDDAVSEATAALLALGYSTAEIAPVLRGAKAGMSVQEMVRFALREFGRKKT